ncbi:U3 small nucleolar RNA-associated protein 6 homolog [Haliotis cracherodii]|uniref:U3 small nucleolar RNA-associated protein 6 homolog n=1 Tax=Haliotis cracherodii TaxID=6455 RepID=UPI0039E9BB1A
MAEFVQQSIEEMLPELEQMERVKLFTKAETRQILKKRQSYEYKLRRRTKCREDFLQYVQYEVNVLKLVEKRREASGCTYKRLEIDVAIIQRIHKLFRLVCLRFQDDIKLWLSHIEFCKSRNERSYVSRLYTRMLQVHNKKPDLWVMAAKWEFEANINPENARTLLQRGLRFNDTSKQLWIEYYRLELLYAEKLRKRRELLEEFADVEQEAVLSGTVAQIVYKKAVEQFPGDVDLALALIAVCQQFPFTAPKLSTMYKDLKELYPQHAVTWNALARRHLQAHDKAVGEEMCFMTFQEAVRKINTKEMWGFYLAACLDVLSPDTEDTPEDEGHKDRGHSEMLHKRAQRAFEVFHDASQRQMVEEKLFMQWVELLLTSTQMGQVEEVLKQATDTYPRSAGLWALHLQVLIDRQEKLHTLLKVFKSARGALKEKVSWPVWEMMLHHLMSTGETATLDKLMEEAILCCREVSRPAKELYLEWAFLSQGIIHARKVYERLVQLKPVSLDFFTKYINMENSQPKPKLKHLRQGYEDAVQEFGKFQPDLWIDYLRQETNHPKGSPEATINIHSRALKMLPGTLNLDFVTKHTLLQTGRL